MITMERHNPYFSAKKTIDKYSLLDIDKEDFMPKVSYILQLEFQGVLKRGVMGKCCLTSLDGSYRTFFSNSFYYWVYRLAFAGLPSAPTTILSLHNFVDRLLYDFV